MTQLDLPLGMTECSRCCLKFHDADMYRVVISMQTLLSNNSVEDDCETEHEVCESCVYEVSDVSPVWDVTIQPLFEELPPEGKPR